MFDPLTVEVGGSKVVVNQAIPTRDVPQRTYACMETDFVNLVWAVHRADTGCHGPITTRGAGSERSNKVVMAPFVCISCGADFGSLSVGGTSNRATALGVLLAGDSFTGWSTSCQYSDQKVMDVGTFNAHQKVILAEVDKLFEEYIQTNNKELKSDPSRRIQVPRKDHFFLKHKDHLLKRMETSYGLEVIVFLIDDL